MKISAMHISSIAQDRAIHIEINVFIWLDLNINIIPWKLIGQND